MVLMDLLHGRGCLDVGGERYFLRVVGDVVQIDGGVLRCPVPIDALMDLVSGLAAAASTFIGQASGDGCPGSDLGEPASPPASQVPRPIADCPMCGAVTPGAFSAEACSVCGHCWRSAPDDDAVVRHGRAGGGR